MRAQRGVEDASLTKCDFFIINHVLWRKKGPPPQKKTKRKRKIMKGNKRENNDMVKYYKFDPVSEARHCC